MNLLFLLFSLLLSSMNLPTRFFSRAVTPSWDPLSSTSSLSLIPCHKPQPPFSSPSASFIFNFRPPILSQIHNSQINLFFPQLSLRPCSCSNQPPSSLSLQSFTTVSTSSTQHRGEIKLSPKSLIGGVDQYFAEE